MRNKKAGFSLLLTIGLLFCAQLVSVAHAQGVSKSSDLAVALERLAGLQGFSCQFEQVLSYAEGGERKYQGELSVLRPGKFRWRYTKPYEQLYVSNGNGVWLYEPDLMQAQRMQDLGEVDPVVLQLLDGRVGLQDVIVLNQEALADGFTSWHVRIGKQSNSVEIWLGIHNKDLRWIESKDVMLNRNRLQLLQLSKKLPASDLFEFVAPEGVDVIGAL